MSPLQIVEADVTTFKEAVEAAKTVIAMAFDVAFTGDTQAALDVMITVTISPFANAVVVNIAALVPVLIPFIFH